MKIRRTIAPSVREAMSRVRQEQGADAVILANRKVADGVEIISAVDYDEREFENIREESQLQEVVQMAEAPEPTPMQKKDPRFPMPQSPGHNRHRLRHPHPDRILFRVLSRSLSPRPWWKHRRPYPSPSRTRLPRQLWSRRLRLPLWRSRILAHSSCPSPSRQNPGRWMFRGNLCASRGK